MEGRDVLSKSYKGCWKWKKIKESKNVISVHILLDERHTSTDY